MEQTADSKLNHNLFLCMHVCGGWWWYMHLAKSNDEQSRTLFIKQNTLLPNHTHTNIYIFLIQAQQIIKYKLKLGTPNYILHNINRQNLQQ